MKITTVFFRLFDDSFSTIVDIHTLCRHVHTPTSGNHHPNRGHLQKAVFKRIHSSIFHPPTGVKSAQNLGHVYAPRAEVCPESGARYSDLGKVCPGSGARLCTPGRSMNQIQGKVSPPWGWLAPNFQANKKEFGMTVSDSWLMITDCYCSPFFNLLMACNCSGEKSGMLWSRSYFWSSASVMSQACPSFSSLQRALYSASSI